MCNVTCDLFYGIKPEDNVQIKDLSKKYFFTFLIVRYKKNT